MSQASLVAASMRIAQQQGATVDTIAGTPSNACFAFFVPVHYEKNYAYPLLVWLHGSGTSEAQLRRIMPLVSLRNYVGVAPSVCLAQGSTPLPRGCPWQQTARGYQLAEQAVFDAIELASRRFHVCRSRIFLAGEDRGGTMALRIALRHPERFRGVVSMNGPFPAGRAPLARLSAARGLQTLILCGRESKRYPTRQVCDDLRLMHSSGIGLTLREYPGGDELSPSMFADVDRWLMAQALDTRSDLVQDARQSPS